MKTTLTKEQMRPQMFDYARKRGASVPDSEAFSHYVMTEAWEVPIQNAYDTFILSRRFPAVTVHVSRMKRRAELKDYAYFRGISMAEAIVELVNKGLSHQ